MEGIFILKVVGDTNIQSITKEPQYEINSILRSFSNNGYPFSTISLMEAYRVSDTFYITYKVKKNNFYIVKQIRLENYYSKSIIYSKFLKKFENKMYSESLINYNLKKLDDFYNLMSLKEIEQNYLKFQNQKIPIDGYGSLTILDSSINGNIDFSFDLIKLKYNKNLLQTGIEIALPFSFLNTLNFSYSKFLEYNNFEAYFNVNGYFSGLRVLNEKLGIFVGYEDKSSKIRLDALDFFYRLYFKKIYKIFTFEGSINQIDKNLIGGYENILGYMENSIVCNNYFLTSLTYRFLILYPIVQLYWIDKSRTLYSYGIGIGNENAKIFFIINGREGRPYLHFIIRS